MLSTARDQRDQLVAVADRAEVGILGDIRLRLIVADGMEVGILAGLFAIVCSVDVTNYMKVFIL
jgi:hypothetical protein